MPRRRFPRPERGQHVDEAEHLHLDRFIGHGPRQDAVIPPAAFENRRAAAHKVPPQKLSQFLRARLNCDFRIRCSFFSSADWCRVREAER